MLSELFKTANCKIPHLKFLGIYQTTSEKNYGKRAYLCNFVFLPPSPLKNVREQQGKLASSHLIGSQHCIGEEGDF